MSKVTDIFRNHHRELANKLKEYLKGLLESPVDGDLKDLVEFLNHELVPHAQGEERDLYPAVEPLIKTHGKATATMTVDHQFIESAVSEIGQLVQSVSTAQGDERSALIVRFQRQCLRLEAIFDVHLEKEERVYLPLFEKHLSETEQERLLEAMHQPTEH